MNIKYIKISLIILGSILLSAIAFATYNKSLFKSEKLKEVEKESLTATVIDTVQLIRFNKIISTINLKSEQLSLSGILNVYDGSDTSLNIRNADYRFCRKGDNFYFKMGKTESLNQKGQFIYVDQIHKKILRSEEKKINTENLLPTLPTLAKQLSDDQYKITEQEVSLGYKKISLFNPNHISCKEYSLVYKEDNLQLMEVLVRLRNLDEPLNDKKDKVITMRYAEQKKMDDAQFLRTERILQKVGQKYVAVGDYKGFEVIDIKH